MRPAMKARAAVLSRPGDSMQTQDPNQNKRRVRQRGSIATPRIVKEPIPIQTDSLETGNFTVTRAILQRQAVEPTHKTNINQLILGYEPCHLLSNSNPNGREVENITFTVGGARLSYGATNTRNATPTRPRAAAKRPELWTPTATCRPTERTLPSKSKMNDHGRHTRNLGQANNNSIGSSRYLTTGKIPYTDSLTGGAAA